MSKELKLSPLRERIFRIIFEADTPMGKFFDVLLIVTIKLSVLVVMLDSVVTISSRYGSILMLCEWGFTIFFTLEYVLRLYCARRPSRYARSFFGMVDLLAILPTYLSLLLPGSQYLLVIRVFRVLRIFRVLKLAKFLAEANLLLEALAASRRKIFVFFYTVLTLVVLFGSLMYVVEDAAAGFTSIPRSIYWAIVTMTTVGYGDISPVTALGQVLASIIMVIGYSIIAVPTGILGVEITRVSSCRKGDRVCRGCGHCRHERDAYFCKMCGVNLPNAG